MSQTRRLEQRLETKQQLQIVPMQLQLGKMLELSDNAFRDMVQTTLNENPALELFDERGALDISDYGNDAPTQSDQVEETESDKNDMPLLRNSYDSGLAAAIDIETLYDHLIAQVNGMSLDKITTGFVNYLLGNIDSNGYFTNTLLQLANDYVIDSGEEIPEQIMNEAWDIVRSLDPAGVGAVSLQDCLLLQLRRLDGERNEVRTAIEIIQNHLDALGSRNIESLSDKTGIPTDTVERAMNLIYQLNPKPGRDFATNAQELQGQFITPDFSVLPDIDNPDKLIVTLLTYTPELTIDPIYIDNLSKPFDNGRADIAARRNTAIFLKQRVDEANNFIQLVRMRQITLLSIITAIAHRQKEFFLTGDLTALKPMVLKDIATDTGYDLSVVSRTTSTRFVYTIGGTFPLKDLFNEGFTTAQGDIITARKIEDEIYEILAKEDKSRPYSDDKIAEILQASGINIARRTVAKYRDKVGIPSARERKTRIGK